MKNNIRQTKMISDKDDNNRFASHRSQFDRFPIKSEVFKNIQKWVISNSWVGEMSEWRGLEIGAGAFPFKESYRQIISSDYVPESKPPWIDMSVDAADLPFELCSLDLIVCQNSFHHLPRPDKFLAEAERVLTPGGQLLIFEPYHSLFGRVFYKLLSPIETFDMTATKYTRESTNRMSDANQALSYLIFVRNGGREFQKMSRGLRIKRIVTSVFTLPYVLCGGVNFSPIGSCLTVNAAAFIDRLLLPFRFIYCLHYLIVLEKVDE